MDVVADIGVGVGVGVSGVGGGVLLVSMLALVL